jgi:hypothetical protein
MTVINTGASEGAGPVPDDFPREFAQGAIGGYRPKVYCGGLVASSSAGRPMSRWPES